jgi:hypothetical protein
LLQIEAAVRLGDEGGPRAAEAVHRSAAPIAAAVPTLTAVTGGTEIVVGDGAGLLIPVGHDLGPLYEEPGVPRRVQQVRAGADVAELDDNDFVVWLLAHGTSDEDRPTRATLLKKSEQLGLAHAQVDAAIERFLADGLLVEVVPDGPSARGFAQQHQLFPLMLGIGSDPDEPQMQVIGLFDQPVAQVSEPMYDMWVWGHLAPDLWTACHDAVEAARRAGVTDPDELRPSRVLAGVLDAVHALLSCRAAYFDRRRPGMGA